MLCPNVGRRDVCPLRQPLPSMVHGEHATFRTAIVAHTARTRQALNLQHTAGAHRVFLDDGTLGAEGNHKRAWDWLADTNPEPWSVVLEDDAVPCEDFPHQLGEALGHAPTPIVSLYLGSGYPLHWQNRMAAALRRHPDAHYLTGTIIHAVGLAIRTELLPIKLQAHTAVDQALANWAKTHGWLCSYTVPSLVDHLDGESVIRRHPDGKNRTRPRRAHRFGGREVWDTDMTAQL